MKRNKNLIELSRDHHHGLLLGWKVKQGLKHNVAIEEIVKYIAHFARQALLPHFEEEESQVLIYLEADDSYKERTVREHTEIRGLIREVSIIVLADQTMLLNLVDALEAHIRFEERELFPYMEKVLSEQKLEAMGRTISSVHRPYLENYPNEFWTIQN